VGLSWTALVLVLFKEYSPTAMIGYLLLLPAVSAWLALEFTGASTFTSPSGVLKEMRIAVPLIIGSAGIGALLLVAQAFVIGRAV